MTTTGSGNVSRRLTFELWSEANTGSSFDWDRTLATLPNDDDSSAAIRAHGLPVAAADGQHKMAQQVYAVVAGLVTFAAAAFARQYYV
jgi:hypothetical protein